MLDNAKRGGVSRKPRQDTGFGARIKQFRQARGLTMQALAQQSGLAQSTISKVEQGQLSPTYENILRLAGGLQVDVVELFDSQSSRMTYGRRSVTRAGEGSRLNSPQYAYEMLCSDLSSKKFIPLLTTIKARSFNEFPGFIQHAGEEFFFVLSGEVELRTEAYAPIRLRQGDSCYFDSTMGHACFSTGEVEATILWVCSQVSFPDLEGEASTQPLLVEPVPAVREKPKTRAVRA